jgi:DNA end-binding protein Ku
MAARSSWKGFLQLSLVSIPVKAYTAANSAGSSISLNQLHAECHSRIRYLKTCPEHGEVSKDEIVMGYEYAKGQYVVVDPDELEKLRTESDRSISIDRFVPTSQIDPGGTITWRPMDQPVKGHTACCNKPSPKTTSARSQGSCCTAKSSWL